MKMSNDVTNVIEEPKCRFDRRVYKDISTASVDSLFIIFSYSLELVQAKKKKSMVYHFFGEIQREIKLDIMIIIYYYNIKLFIVIL